MKKYVKSSDSIDNIEVRSNKDISMLLAKNNIDNTVHKYELKAEDHGSLQNYTRKFSCPGDWLAYLSMLIHKAPNINNLEEYYGEGEVGYELQDLIDSYPTIDDIASYASYEWWGDGDDFIQSLKNLDTGEQLYYAEDDYEEEEEEDEW